MKRKLWELQAIPGNLLEEPTHEMLEVIFFKEFFHQVKGKLKPKKFIDKAGTTVLATQENFRHIFFKDGIFRKERAERIYFIRRTIQKAKHIYDDKKEKNRYHYLQPYIVNGQVESFCVITQKTGKISRIVTAFPVEWSRVYSFLI